MSELGNSILTALDDLSADELAVIASRAKEVADVKAANRWVDAKAVVDDLAESLGVSPAALFAELYPEPKPEPKYRDPASGKFWSGRGNQPGWLKAKIDAGAKLEDFLTVKPEVA